MTLSRRFIALAGLFTLTLGPVAAHMDCRAKTSIRAAGPAGVTSP